jgi:hypothetical protein
MPALDFNAISRFPHCSGDHCMNLPDDICPCWSFQFDGSESDRERSRAAGDFSLAIRHAAKKLYRESILQNSP